MSPQATPQVTPQAERIKDIIEFCATPRSREEIQKHINIQDREYFRKNILGPLLEKEILKQTIPEKQQALNRNIILMLR